MGKTWEDGPAHCRYGRGELGPVMAILRLPLPDALPALHERYPWMQTGLSGFISDAQAELRRNHLDDAETLARAFITEALRTKPAMPPEPKRKWWRRLKLWTLS